MLNPTASKQREKLDKLYQDSQLRRQQQQGADDFTPGPPGVQSPSEVGPAMEKILDDANK